MYDVVVIGGGPGGYAAAIRASQLGGKVALVEAKEMGGTCVNRGCIPSKVWLRAAHLLHLIRNGHELGIKTQGQTVDLPAVVARKNGVANDIRMGMEGLLTNNRVEVVRGRATLSGPREVRVDGQTLQTKKTIVATGSVLRIPDVPGIEEAAMTTDQVLDMTALPGSLLIWGVPGPIEVEIASFLNTLGCKVILAFEGRRILPMEDGDTGQRLGQALREQGVELLPRLTLQRVQKQGTGFVALLSGAEERRVEAERVLVSARKPNTAGLGLEEVGIRLDEEGFIKINDRLETTAAGVYAIGDVTGGWMLSHASSSMAVAAAENAMGKDRTFPFHLVPRGLWTIPEVGAVGLSEEEAEAKGLAVEVGDFPYAINGLAMARGEMTGAVKVISDSRYGEILGVHIVGGHATDLVGEAVMAMQLEARVQELAYSIRVHPTFSESVVDAARDVGNWALYLPRRD
jgi:dihydrolipoamide dehydrogenase